MQLLLWTLAVSLCQCSSEFCLNPAFFQWFNLDTETCRSEVDGVYAHKSLSVENDDPASRFLSFDEWKSRISAKSLQQDDNDDYRLNEGQIIDELAKDINRSIYLTGLSDNTFVQEEMSEAEAPTNTNLHEIRPVSRKAGETSKQRFNYASFDCAATILKANPESKGSNSILVENKDSYMLNECSAPDKFVVVELCDHILIDTVVLANFEFFSSMVREFSVFVSDRYPSTTWTLLGTFQARNAREIQAFAIHNPQIWAKFLRVEFISQYGTEFFCPLSLLRVHGTTMMEEYRLEEHPQKTSQEESTSPTAQVQTVASETSISEGLNQAKTISSVENNISLASHTSYSIGHSQASESCHTAMSYWFDFSQFGSNDFCPAYTGPLQSLYAETSAAFPTLLIKSLAENVPATTTQPGTDNIKVTASHQIYSSRSASETVAQASPMPSTQESFYKAISKRLGNLETNATLSLQYIEDQSRMLRDVFNQMEKKHSDKIHKIVDHLNTTILPQISSFRSQYTQLFREAMSELNKQRETHELELTAINARMTVLANEVIRQKRVGVAQSVLLLTILVFVMMSRGSGLEIIQIPSLKRFVSSTLRPSTERYESPTKVPRTPTLDIFGKVSRSQKYRWSAPAEKWDILRAASASPDNAPSKKSASNCVGSECSSPDNTRQAVLFE